MKLSCVPVSFFKNINSGEMSFAVLARLVSEFGLQAVDLSVALLSGRKESYLRAIRHQVEDAGICIAGIMAYPDFTNPDPGLRMAEISNLEQDIYASSVLGAEFIRITAGQAHKEITQQYGIGWAVEGILKAVELGTKYGIKILYEHHAKPSVWEYPDFNLPTNIFLETFESVKHTTVRVLFDAANPMVYGDDPIELLEKVIDYVYCVHISDIRQKGEQQPVVIGTGIVPIVEIVAKLKEYGYDNWISIEEASNTGEEGLARAARFVKGVWEGFNLRYKSYLET